MTTAAIAFGEGYDMGYGHGTVKTKVTTWLQAIAITGLVALGIAGYSHRSQVRQALDTNLAGPTVYIQMDSDKAHGHGSGVYLGHGIVLTAAHVADPDYQLTVKTNKGQSYAGKILWRIADQDIALVQIDDVDGVIASSPLSCSKPKVGQEVRSEGNPYGQKWISTWGHIAGRSRVVGGSFLTPMDVTILPGMSGGPVYNKMGEVIGINDALLPAPVLGVNYGSASVSGVSFMVPSFLICRAMGRE